MEEKLNITNAEMRVMEIIWKKDYMLSIQDVTDELKAAGEDWVYQTVATFLMRLKKKGVLGTIKKGKNLYYYPLISETQYKRIEARGFINDKFNGSLGSFLTAFQKVSELKESDMEELREWLNDFDH